MTSKYDCTEYGQHFATVEAGDAAEALELAKAAYRGDFDGEPSETELRATNVNDVSDQASEVVRVKANGRAEV